MQRKIFIGVDLPEQAKKRLAKAMEKWQDLPVKWSYPENLHLTVLFLGHIEDEMVAAVCEKVKEACRKLPAFDINLEQILLGPEDDKRAKMFWLTGEPSEKLKSLREDIEKELDVFQSEKKVFRPHITLGRIRKNKWEQLAEIPRVDEKFSFSLPVESVRVFESVSVKGKRKFLVLETCSLG